MLFLFKRIQTVFLFFIFLLFTHCWHQWDWNPERVLRAVFYQGFWGCGIKMIIIFKYISTYVTRIHALAHNLHQLLQKKHWSVALWRCSAQPGQNYGTSSFSPTVSHQDLHMCVSSWEVTPSPTCSSAFLSCRYITASPTCPCTCRELQT